MQVRVRQFGAETAIYIGAQVTVRLLAMVAVAIYARAILPEAFGLLDVALAAQSVLMPLGALGLQAAIKLFWFEDSDPRVANTSALLMQAGAGTGLALAGHWFAPLMSAWLTGTPEHADVFRLGVWAVPFFLIQDHTAGMLRVVQRPWGYALIVVGAAVVQSGLGAIWAVGIGQGVAGVLLAGLVTQVGFAGLGLLLTRRTLAWSASWWTLRRMLAYGVPLVPASLVRWVMSAANRWIFALYGLLGAAGIFGVGFRAGLMALVVAQAFELSWLPFALSITRRVDAPRLYGRGALLYAALAGGVAGGVGLWARELAALLAPPAYAEAAVVAPLVGLAHALGGLTGVLSIGAQVARQTWRISAATATGAAFTLLLTVALIPPLGPAGAAWAMLVGQGVSVGVIIGLVRRVYSVPFPWRQLAVIGGMAAMLCAAGVVWPRTLPLAWTLPLKLAVLVLWPLWLTALGGLRHEDWGAFRRLLRPPGDAA